MASNDGNNNGNVENVPSIRHDSESGGDLTRELENLIENDGGFVDNANAAAPPQNAPPMPAALPLPAPAATSTRAAPQALALVLVRRLAGHGLHDARATMLALDAGGTEFRRLLVLARALVVDLARTSRRRILLAPCCAAGMTRDEGLLMAMIGGGGLDVHGVLTDDAGCAIAMTTAHALGDELERLATRNDWRR